MFRSIPDRILRRWRARTHTTPNNIQTITVLLSGGGGGADMAFRITGELLFVLRWVSSVQEHTIRTGDTIRSQRARSHGRRPLWIERDSYLLAH